MAERFKAPVLKFGRRRAGAWRLVPRSRCQSVFFTVPKRSPSCLVPSRAPEFGSNFGSKRSPKVPLHEVIRTTSLTRIRGAPGTVSRNRPAHREQPRRDRYGVPECAQIRGARHRDLEERGPATGGGSAVPLSQRSTVRPGPSSRWRRSSRYGENSGHRQDSQDLGVYRVVW